MRGRPSRRGDKAVTVGKRRGHRGRRDGTRPHAPAAPASRSSNVATRSRRTATDPQQQTSPRGWAIAGGVVAAVIALGLAFQSFADGSLPTRLQDGLTLAISVLIEAMPFVMLGVLLAVIVEVWVPAGAIERWLPRHPALRRAALSLLGMLIPVCECGNVPFARGLLMRGFTVQDTLTFLMAAPIVNPIVIITTHQAFGWSDGILVARLLGGFAIANLVGWIYSRHPDPQSLLTARFQASCEVPPDHVAGSRATRSAAQMVVELRAIMPALVLGSALAGAIQVLVPRDVLLAVGSNPLLSITAMMALGFVVAICSNVDAFFALSFASAFTPGSIVAFLLVGPLIDVKMLALLRTTFTTRLLVGTIAIIVPSAYLIGSVVNILA